MFFSDYARAIIMQNTQDIWTQECKEFLPLDSNTPETWRIYDLSSVVLFLSGVFPSVHKVRGFRESIYGQHKRAVRLIQMFFWACCLSTSLVCCYFILSLTQVRVELQGDGVSEASIISRTFLFRIQICDETFNHNWFWGNRKSPCVWCCGFLVSYTPEIFLTSVLSLKICWVKLP